MRLLPTVAFLTAIFSADAGWAAGGRASEDLEAQAALVAPVILAHELCGVAAAPDLRTRLQAAMAAELAQLGHDLPARDQAAALDEAVAALQAEAQDPARREELLRDHCGGPGEISPDLAVFSARLLGEPPPVLAGEEDVSDPALEAALLREELAQADPDLITELLAHGLICGVDMTPVRRILTQMDSGPARQALAQAERAAPEVARRMQGDPGMQEVLPLICQGRREVIARLPE